MGRKAYEVGSGTPAERAPLTIPRAASYTERVRKSPPAVGAAQGRLRLRRTAAAILALLAVAAAMRSRARLQPTFFSDAVYASDGRALRHRVAAQGISVASHMPLLTLTVAELSDRLDPVSVAVWTGRLALALTTAAAADLALTATMPPAAAAGTAAIAVLLLSANVSMVSLYALLILLAAAALAWRDQSPSRIRTAASAAAVGMTLLYRSPLAFLPPLLAARALARPREKRDPVDASLMLVVPYLFLLPWIRLNWILTGRLIPFENGEAHTNIVTGALGIVRTIEGGYAPLLDHPLPDDRLATVLGWAAREISRHPWRYVSAFGERLALVWNLHPFLCSTALAAAWLLRARPGWRSYAWVAGYFTVAHCLMSVQDNYFDPLWPLLGVLTAGLVFEAARKAGDATASRWRASEAALILLLLGVGAAVAGTLTAVDAYASAALRRPPDSDRAWDEALARSPFDEWLNFESGRRFLREGNVDEAVMRLGASDLGRTAHPVRELWLDWALYRAGLASPILKWGTPRDADPDVAVAAAILQAVVEMKFGRLERARARLRSALSLRNDFLQMRIAGRPPPPPEVFRRLKGSSTMSLFSDDVLPPLTAQEQLELSRQLGPLDPAWGELTLQHAELALRLGRRDEARAVLNSAPSNGFNRAQKLHAALLRQQLGDYAQALAAFDHLLAEDPDPEILADRGLCEYLQGRPDPARADLREALRRSPHAAAAALTLGAIFTAQGRRNAAAQVYDAALRAGPSDARLRPLLEKSLVELAPPSAP